MSMNRQLVRPALRTAAVLTAAGAFALVGTGVADAHVSAHSPDVVARGGDAEIVFRVPDESDTAGTVKLQVNFSTTSPLSNADARPVPGWTSQVNLTKLARPVKMANLTVTDAVASVVWTAQPGTRINPGEFQEFAIATEGLPDNTDELVMPAVQTYDNGDVVRWNQPTVDGQAEPDHPAPHLTLAAVGDGDADPAAASTGSPTSGATNGTDSTARWLGGIGVVLAALALGTGAGALIGSRRGRTREEASA